MGNGIAMLDLVPNRSVFKIVRGIRRCQNPFVNSKDAAGSQDAVDLRIHGCKGRSVKGGFNGVNRVEGIGRKRYVL